MNANSNSEAIQGLREVADWLEQNPDLPAIWYGSVRIDAHGETARDEMTRVAVALGDRAIERVVSTQVQIVGEFSGRIEICATASPKHLGAVPVEPAYEPILPVRDAVA